MQFKFKNMLLYVRNVVEPFIRAERDISKREIQKLEDFLTRELASMKAHLNQEIADLRAHIIQTTTELRYEMSQISTIEVGFVLPWPTHQALLEAEKWLLCDGSWFDKSKYPRLYEVLGREYTPNYAGMFLRGYGSQSFRQNNGSTVGTTTTYHSSGGLNVVQGDATRYIL